MAVEVKRSREITLTVDKPCFEGYFFYNFCINQNYSETGEPIEMEIALFLKLAHFLLLLCFDVPFLL